MSSLDSFLTEVRPWAPGVPDPTAYKAVRNAAIEFCERTRLWKYESTVDILEADPVVGEIVLPDDAALFDIEVAMFDNLELTPKATRDLDEIAPRWRGGDLGTGNPQYITQIEQNSLRMVPSPAVDGALYVCLRLKPSQDATTLPAFMTEYAECLGWGALGRILTVPGQSYSNPELATYYTGRFMKKLDALSNKGTLGQHNARKRTRTSFY